MWRIRLRELSVRQTFIGAFLLLAFSGVYLLWVDAAEPVGIVPRESAPPPVTEIAGFSAAARKVPLRNPFSYAHEHRGEIPPTIQMAEQTEKVPPLPPATTPPPPVVSTPPSTQSQPPLVLRGIVTGADGTRIAILAKGTDSAALSVGEMWQGHTLRGLTDSSATLESMDGTITLIRE